MFTFSQEELTFFLVALLLFFAIACICLFILAHHKGELEGMRKISEAEKESAEKKKERGSLRDRHGNWVV